jgi:type I restriction-modification system DNA methylase subunit
MQLSEEVKSKIKSEYDDWFESQYAGKSKEERQKLGQFFTPPELTIKMIEKFDSIKDKDILDPTCGAGGLLADMIIVGADPARIFGIELDPEIAEICRKRLSKFNVPENNIKIGNALNSDSYDFLLILNNEKEDKK